MTKDEFKRIVFQLVPNAHVVELEALVNFIIKNRENIPEEGEE